MTQTSATRRRRFGFTLIELLMVITIIGLLAALLFPAVTAAYQHAQTYQCKSQLGQIASSVLAYTTAFNGDIPPAKVTGSNQYWVTILCQTGFIKAENTNLRDENLMSDEASILLCPSTIPLRVEESDTIQYPDDDEAQGWARMGNNQLMIDCSYYWNGSVDRASDDSYDFPSLLVEDSDKRPEKYVQNIAAIKQRTTMAMVLDGVWYGGNEEPARIAARHLGDYGQRSLTCVAFYDGHVDEIQRSPAGKWQDDPIFSSDELSTSYPFFRIEKQQSYRETEEEEGTGN